MKISIIHKDSLLQRVADVWGKKLPLWDLSAEMLRSELAARNVTTRRSLCSRVVEMLEPVGPINMEDIKGQLSVMEKMGDITGGPGGRVAAAPLRMVKLGLDRYQLFGTVGSSHVSSVFAESVLTPGQNRLLIVKGDDLESFDQEIDTFGGIVLSPERWAGLDKVIAAGPEWLQSLEKRLLNQPIAAGSLDENANGEWRTYRPKDTDQMQNRRWAKGNNDGRGRLWRTWHERGWPIHAWTSGLSPEDAAFFRLTGEEASRTMFALDREAEIPLPHDLSEDGGKTIFKIGGFLPGPEYRFLATRGEYMGKSGEYFCFQFEPDAWAESAGVLSERLGIPG